MGSQKGFTLADNAIASSIKNGNCVLLKNVHYAPSLLGQLEKKLHSIKVHRNFRLFLSMETNPKVPMNLLRLSHIFMFIPPLGFKANLTDFLKNIASSHLQRGPTKGQIILHACMVTCYSTETSPLLSSRLDQNL